jgi:hypothetical protein
LYLYCICFVFVLFCFVIDSGFSAVVSGLCRGRFCVWFVAGLCRGYVVIVSGSWLDCVGLALRLRRDRVGLVWIF